jgi:hypothetical protein
VRTRRRASDRARRDGRPVSTAAARAPRQRAIAKITDSGASAAIASASRWSVWTKHASSEPRSATPRSSLSSEQYMRGRYRERDVRHLFRCVWRGSVTARSRPVCGGAATLPGRVGDRGARVAPKMRRAER